MRASSTVPLPRSVDRWSVDPMPQSSHDARLPEPGDLRSLLAASFARPPMTALRDRRNDALQGAERPVRSTVGFLHSRERTPSFPSELDGVLRLQRVSHLRHRSRPVLPSIPRMVVRARLDVWRQVAVGSQGDRRPQQRVHPEKVLSYRIDLPSLDEQRRIVEKLDRVAALVDERRNAIEAAERETQALLLKAFQRAIDGATLRPMAEVAPLVRRPVEIDLDASLSGTRRPFVRPRHFPQT